MYVVWSVNTRGVLVAAAFVFLATYAFFELLAPLWERAGYPTGDLVVLPGLVLYSVALGALLSVVAGVRLRQLLAGGLAVYVPWLVYLETTAGPFGSPVHVLVGVFFLIGFSAGVWLAERSTRLDTVGRRRAS